MTNTDFVLGVDIGGVLIGPGDTAHDTSFFSDDYLRTPQMPGAFAALVRLRDELLGG